MDDHPFNTWTKRIDAALGIYGEASKQSWTDPSDANLEGARLEAHGDVIAIERDMATEFILMLRKADQHSQTVLRSMLAEIMRETIDARVGEMETDIQDLADAIAVLELSRHRKAVPA